MTTDHSSGFNQNLAQELRARQGDLEEELAGLRERLRLDQSLSPEDRQARAQDARDAAEGIHRVSGALKACLRAQERQAGGIGGVCEVCNQPIPPARLLANPSALRCVRCQERAERPHRSRSEGMGFGFVTGWRY